MKWISAVIKDLDAAGITKTDNTDEDKKTFRHNVFDWKVVRGKSAGRPEQLFTAGQTEKL